MLNVPTVFLVDPDARFVQSCRNLLAAHSVKVFSYDSPRMFSCESLPTMLGCIVTELKFPDENGIDFSCQLRKRGWMLPVIIHTAFGDISSCSRAFHNGVSDFLEKTTPPDRLLERILEILATSRRELAQWRLKKSLASKLMRLTDREKEVAQALVSGQTMKAIASEFGTSFQSVARHRKRILMKLEVENDVVLANVLRDFSWRQFESAPEIDSMLATVQD